MCFNKYMNTAQRQHEIYETIKNKHTVEVKELAKNYDVSLMTIRRDLDKLEEQGILTKTYGGAILNESISIEPSFIIKEGQSLSAKKEIVFKASEMIHDSDSIYLDCGTTSLELFSRIHYKRITIFTNFWKVLQYVNRNTKSKIILCPGTFNPTTQAALSEITIEFFKNYSIDKAFISSLGIDFEFGASIPSMSDALVKNEILNHSTKKILLADHTKFNKKYMSKICPLQTFDSIITDSNISDEIFNQYKDFPILKADSLK